MTTREEERLFRELARKGVSVAPELSGENIEPRVPDDFDPNATSVSPSSPKSLTSATAGIDTGTTLGRGNTYPPFDNIPPRIAGLQLPEPLQLTGSNMPGSTIKQLPSVTSQQPGQVMPVAPTPKSQEAEPDEMPMSFTIIVPKQGDPYVGTIPGRANPYGPTGRISPRSPGGQPANDPNQLATSLKAQIENPVGKEKAEGKPDALDSAGVVKLSDDFVNAGTRRVQRKDGPSAAWFEKDGA